MVLERGFVATCVEVDAGAIGITLGVVGIELDGAGVIVERGRILFQSPVGIAANEISLGILGVEPDRFAVIFYRLLVLSQVEMGIAAVEVSVGQFWIGFNDLVLFDNRFLDLAAFVQFERGLERLLHMSGGCRRGAVQCTD